MFSQERTEDALSNYGKARTVISRSCSLCAIDLLRTAVPAIVRDIITIRLVRKAKVQNTRWVRDPNLALITWRKSVCASYLILSYHLEEGLCPRGAHLEHDGEDGEDDDLDGGPARVPVGAADPVLECG